MSAPTQAPVQSIDDWMEQEKAAGRPMQAAQPTQAQPVAYYCGNCDGLKPSSERPAQENTGAAYIDICCDTCQVVIATKEKK